MGIRPLVRCPSARSDPEPELGIRALLIDDRAATADALAALLVAEGCQVHVAPNGEAALRAAEAEPPDLALLDLGLPGIDGVAQRLCQPRRQKRPLVVAFGDRGGEADSPPQLGIDLHLAEPIDPGPLRNLVRRFRAFLLPRSEAP